jgi:DNA-binding MarR family transcriptional regulator
MPELERMGWVERVRTGEISPQGKRFEVWVLTDTGREALRKYLEG